MLNLHLGLAGVVCLLNITAPLPAADIFQPTDDPTSVAALADYGPTRWRKPTGDFYYMSLYGPLVTDKLLPHLHGLKQLSGLDLIRSGVTDAGLAEVAKLPKLTELNLKETSIGDAGVAHLAAQQNLRCLNLAQTRVTDTGLANLEGLVRLQSLELADTQMSDPEWLSWRGSRISRIFRLMERGSPEIALLGGGPRGTLYAVYTYLEDVLGIRFLTADHTHVPRADAAKLPQQFDKTYRPPFGYRFVYYRQNMRDPEFGARMRNNVYAGQERFGGAARSGLVGHSMEHFVPTAKYGKSHPEYFALVSGKRRSILEDSDSSPRGTQLCLTNPDVRRLIVEGVIASLKKNPSQQLISVGHGDNYFYCQCPRCQAVNDREASTMGTMLQVVNEAADAIAKDYPSTYIGTYAYQITRRPPKHLRPRPNVVLQFATIEACQMHGIPDAACPRNAELFADLMAWQDRTRQLFIWNYNTVFPDYMLPCPNLYNVQPNVRLFAEVGSPGAFMQCCAESEGTDLHELRNYLICNLMWDPARSEEKLIDEFLTLHYGPAADTMRKWIALTHDRKRLRDVHCHPFGGPQMYGITPELGEQGIQLLDDAIAATGDPAIKRRLERVLVAPLRATFWEAVAIQRENKDKAPAELKQLDPQRAAALRPNVERFYGICDKFGVTHIGEARPIGDEKKAMAVLFAAAGVPLRVANAAVRAHCKANRVARVLQFNGDPANEHSPSDVVKGIGRSIVYVDPSRDITPAIRDMLNKRTAKVPAGSTQ